MFYIIFMSVSVVVRGKSKFFIDCIFLKQNPDPKTLQINLTGFLDADAAKFTEELWTLLVSAQENIAGIPQVMLEKKKLELQQQMVH